MTKRIMRAFKINEISAVDRPAQPDARMRIMKRAERRGENEMQINYQKVDLGGLALLALEALADQLRKTEKLTKEAAFAKVYSDPANLELRKAERYGNGFSYGGYPPVARTEPAVEDTMAFDKLKELSAEFKRANPFLTPEQAFARIAAAYPDVFARERTAARERLYMNSAGVRITA